MKQEEKLNFVNFGKFERASSPEFDNLEHLFKFKLVRFVQEARLQIASLVTKIQPTKKILNSKKKFHLFFLKLIKPSRSSFVKRYPILFKIEFKTPLFILCEFLKSAFLTEAQPNSFANLETKNRLFIME